MLANELLPGKCKIFIDPASGFQLCGPMMLCKYRCRKCKAITQITIPFTWYRECKAEGKFPEIKCVASTASPDEHDALTPKLWQAVEQILEIYARNKQLEAIRN